MDFTEPIIKNNKRGWKIWGAKIEEVQQQQPKPIEIQKRIIEPKIKPQPEKKKITQDNFTLKIREALSKKRVRILNEEIIRLNAEANYIVEVPTTLAIQKYFVKARNKKTINEQELITAWFESQKHELPVMYITTGKINKKAQKLLETELKDKIKIITL